MITMNELTKRQIVPQEHYANLESLLFRLNIIRDRFNKPMTVTSGYRTIQDHLRIYMEQAKLNGTKFDVNKVPMQSAHLSGEAADISDPLGILQAWCLANRTVLESVGLYCEDFRYTRNWVHFQSRRPNSGNRFFIP